MTCDPALSMLPSPCFRNPHGAHIRPMTDTPPDAPDRPPGPGRRDLLLAGGTLAVASVITIRPALAQATGSILACDIPVRTAIGPDGEPVRPDTPGAAPPRVFKGEDVKRALNGGPLPGASSEQSDAYLNYIRRLQRGDAGFTCFASIQNPRR